MTTSPASEPASKSGQDVTSLGCELGLPAAEFAAVADTPVDARVDANQPDASKGDHKRRAVVVGAGFGGLAIAARLQAQGYRVVVFERSERIGGKLGLFERDGFRFDTGPSIVTLPSVYRDLWAAIGADFDADITLRRLDPIARYRFGDGTWLDASASDATFAENLEKLRLGNAAEMQAFFTRAEAIWEATRGPFLERPLRGVMSLIPLARKLGDLRTIAPGRTMRNLTCQYLSDPRLVNFIDRYATYTGSDPRKAPAALASIPFVERNFGGWYVEGGLVRLGEMLAKRCVESGVSIQCSTEVASILTANNQSKNTQSENTPSDQALRNKAAIHCTGVVLSSGERVEADVVIVNADAHHLYTDLLAGRAHHSDGAQPRNNGLQGKTGSSPGNGHSPSSTDEGVREGNIDGPAAFVDRLKLMFRERTTVAAVRARALRGLQSVQPSLSGFVLCCAVEGTTPALAHHTVLFPEHYDDEFYDLFGLRLRPVRNPTIYVSVPKDPLIAPPGCEAWFILVNAPRHCPKDLSRGVDWHKPGLVESYADKILDQMAARGLDIRSRIRFRELRSPADLERLTGAVGGSIYGTSSNGMRAAFLRPRNQSAIPGLFLVGGSSHPGGGLPLVTLSAQIVAELVLKRR